MMSNLVVARILGATLLPIGTIDRTNPRQPTFSYHESYLELENAMPISASLPLRRDPFSERELKPYFEGLLPEGPMRAELATRLAAREDDYLTLLGWSGLDCIGDVVIREESEGLEWEAGSYLPLETDGLAQTLSDLGTVTRSNMATRLSLAGTQDKVGLAHMPHLPMSEGWMRPVGGAASTHILKASNMSRIEELELLCMNAAELCGLRTAHSEALMFERPVILSERFDRRVDISHGHLEVTRLHQEDLAQAFGVTSGAKYLELEGGTYHAIAQLLYERSSSVLEDIEQLARIAVFDYLIGNCDNHLKNLAVLYEGRAVRLAPAYDLVCTTYFERFSREMGKRLGSTRSIDKVTLGDFDMLAREIGLGPRRMKRICAELRDRVVPAVMAAGERLGAIIETIPYTAEDLVSDMEPRLAVLS